MIKFEDIVKSFKIIGQNATGGGAMLTWEAKIDGMDETVSPPFYKSYQDPQKLCFSRNNSYGPQGIRAHEYLSINKTLLEKLTRVTTSPSILEGVWLTSRKASILNILLSLKVTFLKVCFPQFS